MDLGYNYTRSYMMFLDVGAMLLLKNELPLVKMMDLAVTVGRGKCI